MAVDQMTAFKFPDLPAAARPRGQADVSRAKHLAPVAEETGEFGSCHEHLAFLLAETSRPGIDCPWIRRSGAGTIDTMDNSIALVTGANKGIGKEIARQLGMLADETVHKQKPGREIVPRERCVQRRTDLVDGAKRIGCVMVVGHDCAEAREDAVAEEFVDGALMCAHERHEQTLIFPKQLDQFGRRQCAGGAAASAGE